MALSSRTAVERIRPDSFPGGTQFYDGLQRKDLSEPCDLSLWSDIDLL
jgi:hypothetical protein